MKRYIKTGFFILLLCMIALSTPHYSDIASQVAKFTAVDTIIIDAGHGGMDGGASSASGVSEKEINLAIALELKRLADADGWRVVMTREGDVPLGKQEGSIRSKKTQDLKARKEIIDQEQPLVTVSIHLNSFKEDPSVKGAQVFYPKGPEEEVFLESKKLAESIQAGLIEEIADGTNRVAMSKAGVLIFKNPKSPIAIAECGFLSNEEEAKLLESGSYQKKLAAAIYKGIMEYTGKSRLDVEGIVDSI